MTKLKRNLHGRRNEDKVKHLESVVVFSPFKNPFPLPVFFFLTDIQIILMVITSALSSHTITIIAMLLCKK